MELTRSNFGHAGTFVLLGLKGAGTSRVYDYRYPERIAFVEELTNLVSGDKLSAEAGKITIQGDATFRPGYANSTDLRGSMAVVLAALCADGKSRLITSIWRYVGTTSWIKTSFTWCGFNYQRRRSSFTLRTKVLH